MYLLRYLPQWQIWGIMNTTTQTQIQVSFGTSFLIPSSPIIPITKQNLLHNQLKLKSAILKNFFLFHANNEKGVDKLTTFNP